MVLSPEKKLLQRTHTLGTKELFKRTKSLDNIFMTDNTQTQADFTDPDNKDEIVEQLKTKETIQGVVDLINNVFPDWIVLVLTKFCSNYPHLTENWETLCSSLHTNPARIILVREVPVDQTNMDLLKIFCNCLTKSGFGIRRVQEYTPCDTCHKQAIPTQQYLELMRKTFTDLPETRQSTCKDCMDNA